MRIFSWVQSKLNAKQATTKPSPASSANHLRHDACKEEFSDWPNELLAIGTFGNSHLKESEKSNLQGGQSTCRNQPHNVIPDDGELQKVLKVPSRNNCNSVEQSRCNPALEELTCRLQSLQDEKASNDENCDNSEYKECRLQRSTSLACRRGENISLDKTNISIQKKSLTFLMKKTFACAGGFTPTPVLKDPFQEPRLETSKLEKIIRAIWHKRVYPQGASPRATGKKYLNRKEMPETESEDESSDSDGDGSKWVKTDSEYIVLEI